MSFNHKLILLWKAFLFLFSKKTTLYLFTDIGIGFGDLGLFAKMNVKNMDVGLSGRYQEWKVAFNGKEAKAFIDGVEIKSGVPVINEHAEITGCPNCKSGLRYVSSGEYHFNCSSKLINARGNTPETFIKSRQCKDNEN
ncbi:MAG: hypothetical protein ACD_84C00039G0003 [uncultured bacterium]|nr:MAG: hypothetical protein ACD_84C00039G0003 [uncultured bacterium]